MPTSRSMSTHPLETITTDLVDDLRGLEFDDPVDFVYQPLDYAWAPHKQYLQKFGTDTPRDILLVGMNPGPWGMGQTGIPFGDVDFVTDWMGIDAPVDPPDDQHPERPIEGLDCHRNEVSGSRLWGWAEERFGAATTFFDRFYVHNYCPLLFLQESGRNHAPSKMLAAERDKLTPPCNRALRRTIEHFDPSYVIGVGAWATKRVTNTADDWTDRPDFQTGRILHPSPASPKANQGWAPQAEDQLREIGIDLPD